jgi:energy-converting hydrogenase Eha subunit E
MDRCSEEEILRLKKIAIAARLALMSAVACCCIFLISDAIIRSLQIELLWLPLRLVCWFFAIRLALLTYGIWASLLCAVSILFFPLLFFIVLKLYSRAVSLSWSKGFRLTLSGQLIQRASLRKTI